MKYKRVVIVPYNMGSGSAKRLKESLQAQLNIPVLRVRKTSLKYQPRYSDYILNWGCSKQFDFITNVNFQGNQYCVDKIEFFKQAQGSVCIPEWTTDKEVAKTWKGEILCRTVLNGHSGAGIVLANKDTLVDAPLYVKYKKKKNDLS